MLFKALVTWAQNHLEREEIVQIEKENVSLFFF